MTHNVVIALVVGLAASTAYAGLATSFSKVFAPDTIGPGSVSTLTFTIDNTANPTPVTDLAFSDTLPAEVTIATPANASTNCGVGAVLTAPAGGATITFSGGSVGASSVCTVRVNVTSSSVGTHLNVSGDLTSSVGNLGAAAADLTVATDRPGFTKSFSPGTVPAGTRSTLSFTIDNSANAADALTLDFTDNLPVGMVIAEPSNASTDCGHPLIPVELTATPGTSVVDLFANGIGGFPALGAGSTCFVTVDVVPIGVGALGNVSGELLVLVGASSRSSGKASAVLNVTVDTVSLVKEFTNDPAPPGGSVNLRFTITNRDRDTTATGISFTDDLSAALMGLAATGTPLIDPCGSGSMLSGTGTLSLTGGNLASGASCQFDVTLQVPGGTTSGAYSNTTSSISADLNGSPVMGSPGSDSLFVEAAPILTKTYTDDPVTAGATVTLEFTLTNTADEMAFDIGFTDEFSEVIVSDDTLPADGFCGGSSMASFIDLSPGGNAVLTISGASLAPAGMEGDSCTFSVILNVAPGAPTGVYPNTTSVVTATVVESMVTGNPARDDLAIVAAPLLVKEFTDDPALAGGTVTLQFTLRQSAEAPGDATGIAFTDDLSAALAGLTAIGLPMNDVCGVGSSISGTTNLSFTGGTLSPGESCTFSVTLQVPDPAAIGDHTNTTSSVSATVAGVMASSAPAVDDLNIASLLFSKAFTDDPVIPGGTVTLQFTINNVGPDDADGISFTDNLSDVLAGLTATGLPMNDVCGMGSSLQGLSGDTFLLFSGGSLAAGQMCSFSVTLQVPGEAADGVFRNLTSNLSAIINDLSATISPATDNLTVDSNLLALSKQFTDDPVAPGGTVNLRFDITNLDPANSVTGIAFTDDLNAALAGLAATGLPVAACGGTLSGTGTVSLTGGSLGPGASCSFNVAVSVPAGAPLGGTVTNTTSQVTGTIGGLPVNGDPATDNLRIQFVVFTKAFNGPTVAGGTPTLTFTVRNLDTVNPVSELAFSDNLGAALAGLEATGLPLVNPCGVGSQIAGSSVLSFSGGGLDAGGMCVFNVPLQVPAAASPGTYTNTTSALTAGGLQVSVPASADLSVEPPPTFSKSFSPSSIGVGFNSVLTFTIDNGASAVAATNLAFTDNLPAGMAVAGSPNAMTTCGGTITAAPGSGVIALSGGTVGAGASCQVQVTVTASAAGTLVNVSGNLTSSSGSSGTASDTLTVNPPPSFAKSFAPNLITIGGISTLTFTINNTGSTVNATSLAFTDNLPAALAIAATPNASTTCTGGTLTAMAGGGSISYSGGTVSNGATCTVSVDVTSGAGGTHLNTSGDLTSSLGNSGPASAAIETLSPPVLAKSFTDDPLRPGDLGTLRFMLSNPDPVRSLLGVEFQDNLEAVLTGLVAFDVGGGVDERGDPLPRTDPCGPGSQLLGGSVVSLTGGSLPPGGSCTFIVRIRVPDGASPGMYPNTTSPVTGDLGEIPVSGNPAVDTLTIAPSSGPLDLLKSTSTPQVVSGQAATFNISLRNTGDVTLGGVSVADPLAPACGRSVPDLAPGATFGYTCQSGALTADLTNEATATATPAGGEPLMVSDTAFVEVVAPTISIDKTAVTPQVDEGQPATFMITIANLTESVVTGLEVEDLATPDCARALGVLGDLAAMDSVSYSCSTDALFADLTNTATVTADGGLRASDSATVTVVGRIVFTKVPVEQQINAGDRAEFTITVRNNSGGARTNLTISDPASPECNRVIPSLDAGAEFSYVCGRDAVFNSFVNTATLTVVIGEETVTRVASAVVTVRDTDISVSKVAASSTILEGERAVFTITIVNISPSVKTNVQVSDPLTPDCNRTPAQLGDLPVGGNISFMCQTEPLFADLLNVVTVTATIGSSPAAAAARAAVAAPQGPGITVTAMAMAQVTVVQSPIQIVKAPSATQVNPGDTVQFTITVTNRGLQDISNIVVSDPATPACDATLTGVVLAPGASTSYTCMTGPLSSDLINTATVTGQLPSGDPVTNSDTATVRVGFPPLGLEAIPTLSEVGLMVLFCLLAGAGLWMMKRREGAGAE